MGERNRGIDGKNRDKKRGAQANTAPAHVTQEPHSPEQKAPNPVQVEHPPQETRTRPVCKSPHPKAHVDLWEHVSKVCLPHVYLKMSPFPHSEGGSKDRGRSALNDDSE
ncbi:hypothetical protein NL108_014281 [Boleophthalmus pectinirostris]|nr:hypothetical protein NL108_014281 [Boleophthalmus pectinirostris]